MTRIVVLGATGFVGRNIAEFLARDPAYEVVGVRHERPAYDCPRLSWVEADLTVERDVARVVDGAEIVVHAAAATAGAGANLGDPLSMIVDNQVMNGRVFAQAHRAGVRHVIWFSCSVMYASSPVPRREIDFDPAANPHPAYEGVALTKVYFEKMCAWYAKFGRTRFTVLRHSNVYGPYDKFDLARSHVFGATVTKTLTATDGKVTLWGTGKAARDLIHADDLASAVRAAIVRATSPFELYNIGSGTAVTTREIAERIVRASGRTLEIALDPSRPTIDTQLALDCSHAFERLGWRPRIDLDEGISRTIAWWRENRPLEAAK